MKIKVIDKSYIDVLNLPKSKHVKPIKQTVFWRFLLKTLSKDELRKTNFSCNFVDMTRLKSDEPALFLMNHSCFSDLQIASTLLYDRQYHIVTTDDGFVGKSFLMRHIGCIPTKKFIQDSTLVKDIVYSVKTLNSSILMFPEASYSFDGTATPLPDSLGKLVKLLHIPVISIQTTGAFLRDPLYNNLQKRNVSISATEKYLLSPENITDMSVKDINELIKSEFTFNAFKQQLETNTLVNEAFRADNLERVLYKCPHCYSENSMHGKNTTISCSTCGSTYELQENGLLKGKNCDTLFPLIPDWYSWERECVKKEIENGTYLLDIDVDVLMLVDTKAVYHIGICHLCHNSNGFHLTGKDNLDFSMSTKHSYSLYADYFWYELGDMICIGDNFARYYCFPNVADNIPVAKARLATEELFHK